MCPRICKYGAVQKANTCDRKIRLIQGLSKTYGKDPGVSHLIELRIINEEPFCSNNVTIKFLLRIFLVRCIEYKLAPLLILLKAQTLISTNEDEKYQINER